MKNAWRHSIVTCHNCQREVDTLHTGIKEGELYTDLCESCVGVVGSAELSRNYDRTFQRRHFAKDIIQPDDKAFAKAWGEEAARKHGWNDSDLHKNG